MKVQGADGGFFGVVFGPAQTLTATARAPIADTVRPTIDLPLRKSIVGYYPQNFDRGGYPAATFSRS
jgi:hypothetical protein